MNTEQILSGIRLLFRLWWPATVFIAVCVGILTLFQQILFIIDQYQRSFALIGIAWLVLFVVYVTLGVIFIRLFARYVRGVLGSADRRARSRIILLSGSPFYVLSLLCLASGIDGLLDPDAGGGVAFFGLTGFVGFILVSLAYLLLLHLFLRRPTVLAHQ